MARRIGPRACFVAAFAVASFSCARESYPARSVRPPLLDAPAGEPRADPEPALAEIGPLDPDDLGQRVLLAGERIAFVEKRVMKAGCWDFVNLVYNEAGFPAKARRVVFRGKRSGPYAGPELLRPGDWVMHVNREAANIEHSSIFVRWIDVARRRALALDYVGMKRPATGRLSRHDYSRIYMVIRPKEAKAAAR
jgi:hypothetical protein